MILKYLTLIGMIVFCILNVIDQTNVPGPVYLPLIYMVSPILLIIGLGKKGVFLWPIVTILLLIEGHWIVGWIPAALVTFTIIGNEWLDKKYPVSCIICNQLFEEGEEVMKYKNQVVHANECYNELVNRKTNENE